MHGRGAVPCRQIFFLYIPNRWWWYIQLPNLRVLKPARNNCTHLLKSILGVAYCTTVTGILFPVIIETSGHACELRSSTLVRSWGGFQQDGAFQRWVISLQAVGEDPISGSGPQNFQGLHICFKSCLCLIIYHLHYCIIKYVHAIMTQISFSSLCIMNFNLWSFPILSSFCSTSVFITHCHANNFLSFAEISQISSIHKQFQHFIPTKYASAQDCHVSSSWNFIIHVMSF
jgi:hypothetical protein